MVLFLRLCCIRKYKHLVCWILRALWNLYLWLLRLMWWSYCWNVLAAHSLVLCLIDNRSSGGEMLNRLLPLTIHFLVADAFILGLQLSHADSWTIEVWSNSALLCSLHELTLWWRWSSSLPRWPSQASHLHILLLSSFMVLQYYLIHGTVYCNMRLSSIISSSSCQKATFASSSRLNPIALNLCWLLVDVTLVAVFVFIGRNQWVRVDVQSHLVVLFNSVVLSQVGGDLPWHRRWWRTDLVIVGYQTLAIRVTTQGTTIIWFIIVPLWLCSFSLYFTGYIMIFMNTWSITFFESTLILDNHLMILAVLEMIILVIAFIIL